MKCPGQDTRYWKGDAVFEVPCPECGHMVEFFKDESTRKCKNCGTKVINPKMDFGCAAYCKFAAQCLGELPPELLAEREDLLKDRVAIEMKLTLKKDFKRVGRATRSARYAEKIAKAVQADLAVVLSASYLQDVVVRPEGENGPSTLEEKVAAAQAVLEKLGAREDLISEVCEIIKAIHTNKKRDTINYKTVHDAILIGELQGRLKKTPEEAEPLGAELAPRLITETGEELLQTLIADVIKNLEKSRDKQASAG